MSKKDNTLKLKEKEDLKHNIILKDREKQVTFDEVLETLSFDELKEYQNYLRFIKTYYDDYNYNNLATDNMSLKIDKDKELLLELKKH